MILESRKWRLVLRIVALVLTTGLMLAVAGPVSYALQDDTPRQITFPRQLYGPEGEPLADIFAYLEAVPDLDRSVRTGEDGDTRYWLPLRGYGGTLFVRTEEGKYLLPYRYTGALDGPLTPAPSPQLTYRWADTAAELDERARSTDEPLIALFWAVALVGAWQIWRGRQRPRRATRIL